MRGQVAFESLFVLLIVLTAAIGIGSYYLQLHDDTMAISATRAETLNQLGAKNSNSIIESVKVVQTGADTNVIITLTPPTQLNTALISQKVAQVSRYKNASITVQ